MPAKPPHAVMASGRWTKLEKGGMTHQLNRDIERKTRGGRTLRRAAPASPGREEHSAREKFLTASLDLFAERNFASVTIKDIAKALNVNTALIYYYFDSKTDLFRATIEYAVAGAFENVRALDDRSADPPAIIAAWLSNHVNKFAEIHRFVKASGWVCSGRWTPTAWRSSSRPISTVAWCARSFSPTSISKARFAIFTSACWTCSATPARRARCSGAERRGAPRFDPRLPFAGRAPRRARHGLAHFASEQI
jgi:AcrR family transcriptional regulator